MKYESIKGAILAEIRDISFHPYLNGECKNYQIEGLEKALEIIELEEIKSIIKKGELSSDEILQLFK